MTLNQAAELPQATEASEAPASVATPAAFQFMGLVREIREYLEDNPKISQAGVARECGISAGAVSAFLAGSYKGNNEVMAETLQRWLDGRKAKASQAVNMPAQQGFVETPTTKDIAAVLMYSRAMNDIGLVYGDAGVSKSETFKRYVATHNNVWLCEMTSANTSATSALKKIATVVGARHWIARADYLEEQIMQKVRGTAGLLIIDEAQHLDMRSLEAIRALNDQAGIGVVLGGNETVYSRLTGGGARTAEFAQLFSRIGKKLRVRRPTREDVQLLAAAWGVKGKAELDLLMNISSKPGALRVMVKTLRLASMMAVGKSLDAQQIADAWRDLGGVA